jgi:fluoroacetyl-CoA thioesterase
MELTGILQAGMTREEVFTVESQHSAAHVGSGSARVLATPWLIAFMERTARDLLAAVLPAGYSSVGVHVDIRHVAPSPVGSRVRSRVEVTAIEGMKVDFTARLWDEQELVGEGTHQRVVIEEERFLRRVASKIAAYNRE